MEIGLKLEGYICGTDILNDYNHNDYRYLFGNDFYNKFFASTRALGRLVFDTSLLFSISGLANGDEKQAGIAALVVGGAALADLGFKALRTPVIWYKLIRSHPKNYF
jgi:hypothetical protein